MFLALHTLCREIKPKYCSGVRRWFSGILWFSIYQCHKIKYTLDMAGKLTINKFHKNPTILYHILSAGKGVYKQFQEPSGQSTTYTYTPREVMKVQKGYAYRFRMISNGIMNAPIRVSIDNHRMTLIASDGAPFQPVTVDYFIIYAGERWDFVVNASQSVGNYWINMKGLLDGKPKKSHTTAILRYKGAPESNPAGNPSYDTMTAAGVVSLLFSSTYNSSHLHLQHIHMI